MNLELQKYDREIAKMRSQIPKRKYRFNSGVTLIEIVLAMALNSMIALAVGILLISGNRGWQNIYDSANSEIRQDAIVTTLTFGSVGRKANRLSYHIYKAGGGSFLPALPQTSDPQEVVSGDAVEFRYWDVALDETDSYNLMDTTKIATAYALFYIDGDKLKVDYGPYPPGGVPEGGGHRNTTGVTTKVLAENVSVDEELEAGAFSHTVVGGVGQGSVRINIVLTDPETGKTEKIMTSTLMRNIWPR
jgi:hypothetical protein